MCDACLRLKGLCSNCRERNRIYASEHSEPLQYNGHNGLAVFADATRRLNEGKR